MKYNSWDDDIILEVDSVISEIGLQQFIESIGGNIEEVIKKNEKSHDVKT